MRMPQFAIFFTLTIAQLIAVNAGIFSFAQNEYIESLRFNHAKEEVPINIGRGALTKISICANLAENPLPLPPSDDCSDSIGSDPPVMSSASKLVSGLEVFLAVKYPNSADATIESFQIFKPGANFARQVTPKKAFFDPLGGPYQMQKLSIQGIGSILAPLPQQGPDMHFENPVDSVKLLCFDSYKEVKVREEPESGLEADLDVDLNSYFVYVALYPPASLRSTNATWYSLGRLPTVAEPEVELIQEPIAPVIDVEQIKEGYWNEMRALMATPFQSSESDEDRDKELAPLSVRINIDGGDIPDQPEVPIYDNGCFEQDFEIRISNFPRGKNVKRWFVVNLGFELPGGKFFRSYSKSFSLSRNELGTLISSEKPPPELNNGEQAQERVVEMGDMKSTVQRSLGKFIESIRYFYSFVPDENHPHFDLGLFSVHVMEEFNENELTLLAKETTLLVTHWRKDIFKQEVSIPICKKEPPQAKLLKIEGKDRKTVVFRTLISTLPNHMNIKASTRSMYTKCTKPYRRKQHRISTRLGLSSKYFPQMIWFPYSRELIWKFDLVHTEVEYGILSLVLPDISFWIFEAAAAFCRIFAGKDKTIAYWHEFTLTLHSSQSQTDYIAESQIFQFGHLQKDRTAALDLRDPLCEKGFVEPIPEKPKKLTGEEARTIAVAVAEETAAEESQIGL